MKTQLWLNLIKKRSDHDWLVVIITTAVLLRLAVALYMGDHVVALPGTFDQVSYDTLAQRVLAGYGFSFGEAWWPATPAGEPTAHWSYLYTLYLAGVYALVGYHPLVARLIQAVLVGTLMPWLGYRLGRRYFGTKVGLVVAGLTAGYAYFIYYTGALLTEPFYITAVMWTLDLAGQLGQAQVETPSSPRPTPSSVFSWREGVLLGLALAGAVLLRQLFLLFIPFLFGWLLWRSYRYQSRPLKQMIVVLAIAAFILILAIAPWTWRNYQAFNRLVLLNTNAGFAFFWGNHPIHGYNFISILPEASYGELIPAELLSLNEAELDQALLKRGLGFIQADPVRYLVLSLSRVKDYFKFWPSAESGLISNLSRVFSFGLLWPFMAFGFVYYFRRALSGEILILYIFTTVYTAIHLLSWTLIRYRLPVDAVLLVLAGSILAALYTRWARRLVKPRRVFTSSPLHSGD